MELYQLKGFVKTARLGNLTKASEVLNITQPALSYQIKMLEQELGHPLFQREGRRLKLNATGKLLLQSAEQMLGISDTILRQIKDLDSLKQGKIDLGTNDSNGLYLLPEIIQSFRKEYPAIQFNIFNSHSSQIIDWVLDDTIELGIATLAQPHPAITHRVLYEREDVLILHPKHRLAKKRQIDPRDLEECPFLMLHRGSLSHSRTMEVLKQESYGPQQLMRIGSIEVIKRYVELGIGVSIIPKRNCEYEVKEGRLFAKSLPWLPKLKVGVIFKKNGYISPAAEVFLEKLTEYGIQEK